MDITLQRATRRPSLEDLVAQLKLAEPVYVTQPTMPDLRDYLRMLERIWDTKWLTNDGAMHGELRSALAEYLGVDHISLCCNGTVALLIALQACRINSGEVITTPFTFPATAHALYWNRLHPVFCDIEPETFNLDPGRIEGLIGPETRAILPVHVFGYPCDVEAIQTIADRHGLTVIYDAAHTMGVRYKGRSILSYGDMSILSFHATKLFTTAEGGAIISRSEIERERVDFLKNFGIADEETVIGPGVNGKMNEFQAAFGLLQLRLIDSEIANREKLTQIYREKLRRVPGIFFKGDIAQVRHNYSYFSILVDPEEFGMSRDQLYDALKLFNVHPRKYFHPLCSRYPSYASLPSADPNKLPVAERVAGRVLCLPLYGSLEPRVVEEICAIIEALHSSERQLLAGNRAYNRVGSTS